MGPQAVYSVLWATWYFDLGLGSLVEVDSLDQGWRAF